jgi:hypothetical protein
MPQQFYGPVTITGAGNQVLELTSTDPAASVTRLMAVTSNKRTESQLEFKSRLLLVAPLGEGGSKPIATIGEDGNFGVGTPAPLRTLHVAGNLTLDPGTSPVVYTGTGNSELNRYLQLINSPDATSASGLKAGGVRANVTSISQ